MPRETAELSGGASLGQKKWALQGCCKEPVWTQMEGQG